MQRFPDRSAQPSEELQLAPIIDGLSCMRVIQTLHGLCQAAEWRAEDRRTVVAITREGRRWIVSLSLQTNNPADE